MNTASPTISPTAKAKSVEKWFDNFVEKIETSIRFHQLQIETGTADKAVSNLYDALMSEDEDSMASNSLSISRMHFFKKITVEYLNKISKNFPLRLGLQIQERSNKIRVWAETKEDDQDTEYFLYDAEAQINADYLYQGFYLETIVVEDCDNMDIPSNYKEVKIVKK